jgi:hypothetical protein
MIVNPPDDEKKRTPDSFVLDLGDSVATYQRKTKHIANRVDTDPGAMINYITNHISSSEYDECELYDAVSQIEYNVEEQGAPKVAACLADAAMTLGQDVVKQLNDYGLYSPDGGSFDYYFAGWATDRAAVFRRRPEEEEPPLVLFMRNGPPPDASDDEDEDDDEENDNTDPNRCL